MIESVPISHILILTSLMFFIGVYGFLTRKNLITILISIEIILNSVNINFVVFNRYLYPNLLEGHFFSLFVIAIAAAEAAVAIAIFINLYRNITSIDVEKIDEWVLGLHERFGGTIAIAVELSRGPIVNALQKYDFLTIFPINPTTLARYRDTFHGPLNPSPT